MNNINKSSITNQKDQVVDAATEFLYESKKLASDIYQEGINKVNQAEESVKQYSNQLVCSAQEKPITSLFIAAGIGYLLAKILK